jgi:sugar fermentation stimulation protein A
LINSLCCFLEFAAWILYPRLRKLSYLLGATVKLSPDLVEGRFVVRLNRFSALVEVDGREAMVHVPDSGRLRELLVPGYRILLRPVLGDHRKCGFDLALVDLESTLVSADARLPSHLLAEAMQEGRASQFRGYSRIRREVTFGESRLDLLLEAPGGLCYVETKSVTLVVNGAALFPDAPTIRGVRHLNSLAQAVAGGHRAAVVFVVQRNDATAFSPHDTADPEFGRALRLCMEVGVEAIAYCCRVSEREIKLAEPVPVEL